MLLHWSTCTHPLLLFRFSYFFLVFLCYSCFFFFSSRRRHTRFKCDWSSDVCSSDLEFAARHLPGARLIPYEQAAGRVLKELKKGDHIVFVCHTGPMGDELARLLVARSEERRVGKECRSRGSPYH